MQERLQKIIARAGIASRRHAEELIVSGQVTVNGVVVTQLGTKADPACDSIKVGNRLLRLPEQHTYLALNKPPGVVATMADPEQRPTLRDLVRSVRGRLFPVGRLEYDTSGLLLLTSDGELGNRLVGAGKKGTLEQVWWLKVKGVLTDATRLQIERATGTRLRPGKTGENPWYEVRMKDASSDRLRNKLFQAGFPVEKMRRVQYGPIPLGNVPPGQFRMLDDAELRALRRAAAGERVPAAQPATANRPKRSTLPRRGKKHGRRGGRGSKAARGRFTGGKKGT